ncbi:protein arginine kinase [Peptococcaceae bacterium]|nr:protein arginine kinase [Peptococcaceae bacterium]
MGIRKIVNSTKIHWLTSNGPERDVIVSSRVRIARNLANIPFPGVMFDADAESIFHAVKLAVAKRNDIEFIWLRELSDAEREILMEKHLISPDLLENYEKKAVMLSEDETISIMLNEEDHLRIQSLLPGLQLERAWNLVNELDDLLEETLGYAFCEQLGYLTSCPTNVGTGLRASAMLHLPALNIINQINSIMSTVSKLRLAVRGLYGEGSEAKGNLYQVSNQITLGHTEEEILKNLNSVIKQIIDKERKARKALYEEQRYYLEDRVFRAYGTLKYARLLTSNESMNLISDVKLGANLKIIDVDPNVLNELMIITRLSYLTKYAGKKLDSHKRDILRAELVRSKLKNLS